MTLHDFFTDHLIRLMVALQNQVVRRFSDLDDPYRKMHELVNLLDIEAHEENGATRVGVGIDYMERSNADYLPMLQMSLYLSIDVRELLPIAYEGESGISWSVGLADVWEEDFWKKSYGGNKWCELRQHYPITYVIRYRNGLLDFVSPLSNNTNFEEQEKMLVQFMVDYMKKTELNRHRAINSCYTVQEQFWKILENAKNKLQPKGAEP